jgi:hypothetical protein
MKRLAEENPHCIIFNPGRFIPYPGSKLYELAIEHGFKPPDTPEGWSRLDQEEDICMPWYTKKYTKYLNMLNITSYAISNWEHYLKNYGLKIRIIYRAAKFFYKPIANFRISTQFPGFLLEYRLFSLFKKIFTGDK